MNPEEISWSSGIGGSCQKYFTNFSLANLLQNQTHILSTICSSKMKNWLVWTSVTAFTLVKLVSSISTRILGSMWWKWHFPWRPLTQTNPRKFGKLRPVTPFLHVIGTGRWILFSMVYVLIMVPVPIGSIFSWIKAYWLPSLL